MEQPWTSNPYYSRIASKLKFAVQEPRHLAMLEHLTDKVLAPEMKERAAYALKEAKRMAQDKSLELASRELDIKKVASDVTNKYRKKELSDAKRGLPVELGLGAGATLLNAISSFQQNKRDLLLAKKYLDLRKKYPEPEKVDPLFYGEGWRG